MPKTFIGKTLCAVFQKFSGSEKVYGQERRGIKTFRRKFFVSQCRKIHKAPFCAVFQKTSDSEKVYGKKGRGRVSSFSFESFFCLIMRKSFIGKTFCAVFQKFSGSQKVYGKEGGGGRVSRFSFEGFFVS